MNTPKPRALILIALGLLMLGGFIFLMLRSGPLAPVRVTTATVVSAVLENSVFGVGVVEAERSYAIGPTIASRVQRVLVDVGDSVKAGQLLAEMDPVDLDERVAASQAAIARARHAVDVARAQLRDAEVRQDLAARNARRYASLGEQAFFSDAAVESKQQESQSALAVSSAARAQLEAARLDLERLGAERAAVEKLRANVRLHAPVAGVVTARDAEPGTTLVAGQSVLRMVDPTSVRIRTRIDQGRAGAIRNGQEALVVLRSRPGTPVPGKVARIEFNSDAVTEERIVQVGFDHLPGDFSLGELAEVTIATTRSEGVLAVPNAALHRQGDASGVWRVEDGTIRFVPVQLGETALDGRVVVLAGLREGERIVVHSERELRAEDSIKVVESLDGKQR
ncbi:efflux RND transporter periplasmic adaptor subunit [Aromatoleum diolicum]|uniref:Efflux RND transporter periplasmic adaptor subunit n=1 Tax=Aromatoleum diolicum TaxID=75796 RepID=A0ABX1QD49_9RHOO|nr:efflux RND transporter periplasmic adaptor subunit [Aromatoleum diolicum]NMG75930.1 efflux RND transporter periplasmic adaptor subunit [Aromatoleum diolicum]